MCGVAGIHCYRAGVSVDREALLRMREAMVQRGPDGAGLFFDDDGRIGLGHRRLSIIDLSERGAQPMSWEERKLTVTYNGEIYNFRQLRGELERLGHRFHSESDTEVLLHLYAEYGADMVTRLRGMYAFALWDGNEQGVLLARDPLGIKPLFYADDGSTVRFASQVKALVAGGGVSRSPEPAGLVGFLMLGSVPEPWTCYRGIKSLAAGHTMWVDARGRREPKAHASVARTLCEARRAAPPELVSDEAIRDALLDSVRAHLVADVPVGAFLSAGVDSCALVGLMREAGQQELTTVTMAFEQFKGGPHEEAPLAEQVAKYYGTNHHTVGVSNDDFIAHAAGVIDAMDQPTVDGFNAWLVSRSAAEVGLKVAVSGLGGDELFGGYPSFRDVPRWVRAMKLPAMLPLLPTLWRYGVEAARARGFSLPPKLAGLPIYGGSYAGAYLLRRGLFMPWELDALLPRDLLDEGLRCFDPVAHLDAALTPDPGDAYGRVAALETSLYMRNQLLRDADWASMAHSLEVRVPLVDFTLLRRLAPLLAPSAGQRGKHALARAPRPALPSAVIKRPKTGFFLPMDQLLDDSRAELESWRSVALLRRPDTHWSRRLGYALSQRLVG